MAALDFDFDGARKAGYSDAEIAAHLAETHSDKFDVKGAIASGYSPAEVVQHLSGSSGRTEGSGVLPSLQQGLADVPGGIGATMHEYLGAGPVGDALTSASKQMAPENFVQQPVISKDGVDPGALPSAVARAAPGVAAGVAAMRMAPGPWWAKLLSGAATGAGMTMGNEAQTAAANRTGDPNAPTNTEDKVRGAITGAVEGGINSVGLGRFMPKGPLVNTVTAVGAQGLKDSAAQLAKTVAIEAGTGGASNVAGQVGQTVGTPGGTNVDPAAVANAAVVQGATGGMLRTPRAVADAAGAIKYRSFGGANTDATTSAANDIADAAGGADKLTPNFFSGKGKQGYNAVREADDANTIALTRQAADLKEQGVELSPIAEGVLKRAKAGEKLSERDHQILADGLDGASNASDISFLARKASVFGKLKEMGDFNKASGTFRGGIDQTVSGLVHNNLGHAALMTGVAEASGAHIIAHSPWVIGGAVGAKALGRVVDNMTGNVSPAARFAKRFADPNATPGPAPAATAAPASQQGPWGPYGEKTAPVPQMPLAQPQSKIPAGYPAVLSGIVQQMNREGRQANRGQVSQAMPLLRQLAATQGPKAPTTLPAGFASTLSNPGPDVLPNPLARTTPPANTNTPDLQQTIAATKKMVQAIQWRDTLKQKTLGTQQAEEEAAKSPLLDQTVGGPEAVENPAAGKRMSQMLSAAKALQKMRSDPEAQAEEAATAKADAAAAKAAAPKPLSVKITKTDSGPVNVATSVNGSAPVFAPRTSGTEAMDTAAYADHKMSGYDLNAARISPAKVRGGILKRDGIKAGVAAQLAAALPDVASAPKFLDWMRSEESQATAKQLRDHIAALAPGREAVVHKVFNDDAIKAIWANAGHAR